MDILSWDGLLQCLFHFLSPLPEKCDASSECHDIAHKCNCFMKTWFAFTPVCEQLSDYISIKNLGRSCGPFFLKISNSNSLFTSASQWRLFTFLCGQLLKDSVIQQKWWNKMIVTYYTFQLRTNTSPNAIILKVNFDHVIFKLFTSTATSWIPPHPCFIKMSTVIQVIIYYSVSAHLLAGRHRSQKLSHLKIESLPFQVWQDSLWGDNPICHCSCPKHWNLKQVSWT